MMLLVSGATKTLRKFVGHPNLGYLSVPDEDFRSRFLTDTQLPYAADNGCFSGLNRERFIRMLDGISIYTRKPIFVTAPDVVADAKETYRRFKEWGPYLSQRKLPIAFVSQDGQSSKITPWKDISALFIGGSTEWKLGKEAKQLVYIAKDKGLWVHMGRVNSYKRVKYALKIGCDSFDGTSYSRFPDTFIPRMLRRLVSLKGPHEMVPLT